jgi:hypothetical protein
MKKIFLLAIIGITSLATYSQNITYNEIISGAEDHNKFKELLLSKDYVIESHDVDKDGYVTDVFYPIKLAYKRKDLKIVLSYKPNLKLAFINLNICEEYLIDFKKIKDYIKTYLKADKTYFNTVNYTTRYSDGKNYFTIMNYLNQETASKCMQITCSKKF